MRRSERAFTLLEVMAAVAVVAIVFTTLARVASQGLHSQGTSRRRFEASLLADRALADIEAGMQDGVMPELGQSESEEGIFEVAVEVLPFDLAAAIPAELDSTTGSDAPSPPKAEPDAESTPIRMIEVTVRWEEGFDEFEVVRTTFGLDRSALDLPEGVGAPTLPLTGGEGVLP